MDLVPPFILILPVVTVLAVGLLGSTRRIGFWVAVLCSVLLTPIGGFIIALISGPKWQAPPKKAYAGRRSEQRA